MSEWGPRDDGPCFSPATRRQALQIARRCLSDSQEAEDVVQEALIRAWRNRHTLRDQRRFRPWLAQIVHNEAVRVSARRRPELAGEVSAEFSADDLGIDSAPERLDLRRELGRLEQSDRLLLRLRYDLDLTQARIATELGWPEGTVKVRLHRARARLKQALGQP